MSGATREAGASPPLPAVRIFGTACLVLLSACAGVRVAPPDAIAQPDAQTAVPAPSARMESSPAAPKTPRPEAIRETVAIAPTAAITPDSVNEAAATVPAPAPPTQPGNATKAAPPPAKVPDKVSLPHAAIEPARGIAIPPAVAKKTEPPLDVAALKLRLRDTKAIGVFTKLALKNQVDDLMQQFRAHYLAAPTGSVAALRQPYDMLILKVLAMIQDSDPSLARTISGSREAIWAILADPDKFNSAS